MASQPPNQARPGTLVSRRLFLAGAAAGTAGLLVERIPGVWAAPARTKDDPFTLGVASSDPSATGVVLWTRLAPWPLDPDGGMPRRAVPVDWQVATDPRMRRVVRGGRVLADPRHAHAVHVEVEGLEPGRPYWYRFHAGGHLSRLGRTRTCPDPDRPLGRLDLAVVSCQSWESGYYTAYRHLADDDVDVVLHLGDYIYETAARRGRPRMHVGGETTDLAGYRVRHALYKTDPDLQEAHARHPFAVTFDDHEVNNHAGRQPAQDGDPAAFVRRRTAAYRAAWEHLPLRRPPRGARLPLYRRLRFGDLVEVNLLDTRQYRDDHPCQADGGIVVTCPERTDKRAPSSATPSAAGCWTASTDLRPVGTCSPSRWSWPTWTCTRARADRGVATPGTAMSATATASSGSCGNGSRPTRWCSPATCTPTSSTTCTCPAPAPTPRWWRPSWSGPRSARAPAATRRSAST